MAVFLYSCPRCGEFEDEHPVEETRKRCPKCRFGVKRLIYGSTAVRFKGGGWAQDGYEMCSHPRFSTTREGHGK